MIEPVALSGGPIEGEVEGGDWLPGTEKAFEKDGYMWHYRRNFDDDDLGLSSGQAVYTGRIKIA